MKVEIMESVNTGTIGYCDMILRHGLDVVYHAYYKVGILVDKRFTTVKVDIPLLKIVGPDDTPEAVAFIQSSIAEITEERMQAIEAVETNPISIVVKSPFEKPIHFCALSYNQITENFIDDHLYSESSIASAPFVEEYLKTEKKPYIELRTTLDSTYKIRRYKARFKNYGRSPVFTAMSQCIYTSPYEFLQMYKTRIEKGKFS